MKKLGYNGAGIKYGVSNTTIKKWVKFYEMHGDEPKKDVGSIIKILETDKNVLATKKGLRRYRLSPRISWSR